MKRVGVEVAHPGLGNIETAGGDRKFHSYYQWVPFMLFFQGVLFYIPHWMWKQWEEGKIRTISEGMRGALIDTKEERQIRANRLVQYIYDTLHLHNSYAAGYFFCEALNFVNVVSLKFLFFISITIYQRTCNKQYFFYSQKSGGKHIFRRYVFGRFISELRY